MYITAVATRIFDKRDSPQKESYIFFNILFPCIGIV